MDRAKERRVQKRGLPFNWDEGKHWWSPGKEEKTG